MAGFVSEWGLRRLPGPAHLRRRDRHGRELPDPGAELLASGRARPRRAPSRAAALARAAVLFDAGRFFEAHQHLHHVWQFHAAAADRDFWKAVTQVAAGCVHAQRGNDTGARTLLARALAALAGFPSPHQGVEVDRLIASVHQLCGQVERYGASADLVFPGLPRTP